jgi:itaconate CoA-transferase
VQQPRSGAEHATIAPYGPFGTADGSVFFGMQNEREWLKFCEVVLQDGSVAVQEQYVTNGLRVANRPELHERINQTLAGLPSAEVLARLDAAGIANAELRDMRGFSAHPQLEARHRWQDVDSSTGPLRSLIPPVTSRNTGFRMDGVPELGAHTAAVLSELAD